MDVLTIILIIINVINVIIGLVSNIYTIKYDTTQTLIDMPPEENKKLTALFSTMMGISIPSYIFIIYYLYKNKLLLPEQNRNYLLIAMFILLFLTTMCNFFILMKLNLSKNKLKQTLAQPNDANLSSLGYVNIFIIVFTIIILIMTFGLA